MTKFTAGNSHIHLPKNIYASGKTLINSSSVSSQMSKNHLLEILTAMELRRLLSKLELIELGEGQILSEANQRGEYVYFPLTAVIASLYTLENGTSAAVNLIGNDGLVGIAALLGAGSVPHETVVICPGRSLRIKNLDLLREFRREGVLYTLVLRFTMALSEHTARTAVCNRLHPIELQLCRWILLIHDRLENNTIFLTHELIAKILGSSRESISITLKKLKLRNLIEYKRGEITLLNRLEIEAVVCSCYRRTNQEYNRLMIRGISRTFG